MIFSFVLSAMLTLTLIYFTNSSIVFQIEYSQILAPIYLSISEGDFVFASKTKSKICLRFLSLVQTLEVNVKLIINACAKQLFS